MNEKLPMPEPETTSGFDMLKELSGGDLQFQFTAKLKEVLAAVMETEKPVEIKITLKIVPETRYGGSAHKIIPEINIKKPEAAPLFDIRFVTKNLEIMKDDQRQMKFSDLRIKEIVKEEFNG